MLLRVIIVRPNRKSSLSKKIEPIAFKIDFSSQIFFLGFLLASSPDCFFPIFREKKKIWPLKKKKKKVVQKCNKK